MPADHQKCIFLLKIAAAALTPVLMVEQGSLIFSQLKVVMWVLFGLGM
jgi:hypothetical protein